MRGARDLTRGGHSCSVSAVVVRHGAISEAGDDGYRLRLRWHVERHQRRGPQLWLLSVAVRAVRKLKRLLLERSHMLEAQNSTSKGIVYVPTLEPQFW